MNESPCIVCYTGGTGTYAAFTGSLEWQAAALVKLGVPQDEATATIKQFGIDDGTVIFQVWQSCAGKAGIEVHPLGVDAPAYYEPPWIGAEAFLGDQEESAE